MEKIESMKLRLESVAEVRCERESRQVQLFVKGPIPLQWLGQAARLPGKALHVGLLLWFRVGCEVAGYAQHLEQHILPSCGHLKVRDIHRRHVKALLHSKQRAGYSRNTVRLIKATLSSVLSDAVENGIRADNPALSSSGKRKRAGTLSQSDRHRAVRPMNWEQRGRLLSATGDVANGVLFEVMVKTGLRPGEAFALNPDDVDLESRKLRVERALTIDGQLKATKTSEFRDVDLSRDVVTLLAEYIPWLRQEGLKRGWGEVKWLFPNGAGDHLDHNTVAKDFKRLLKRAGLPSFRFYDLRHTYASLLLARCAPITYVSAQLGHSKPDTTLRHYARWIPREGQTFADLLDEGPGQDQVIEKDGTTGWHQTGSGDESSSQPT